MKRILGVAAVCAIGSSAFGQDVVPAYGESTVKGGSSSGGGFSDADVYDNSFNLVGFLINGADAERGDGVTLGGTDRVMDNITLLLHANGGDFTADLQVRVYGGGDLGGGDPCTMVWESALFPAETVFGGTNFYDFPVPNVVVPDEITWTVEMTNVIGVGTNVAGSRFVAPPVLGTSEDWVWTHAAGVWTQNVFGVGLGNNSYGAIISALPGGTVAQCGSSCPCACDMDLTTGPNVCDLFDFLAFQGGFVAGDPCQCDIDTTTGPGVCDLFDFLAFQGAFVTGCP